MVQYQTNNSPNGQPQLLLINAKKGPTQIGTEFSHCIEDTKLNPIQITDQNDETLPLFWEYLAHTITLYHRCSEWDRVSFVSVLCYLMMVDAMDGLSFYFWWI